jgi:hypothetical protein
VSTLEEQFARRKRPTEVVPLPADPDEYARLERAITDARWALEDARARNPLETTAERATVERIEAELAALEVLEVTLVALPPDEWEELVALHPPTPEQQAQGFQWDKTTFRPALLTVSVRTENGVAVDWARLSKEGQITAGELNTLYEAAVMLNMRGISASVGKGR